jgi:plastocyanin
MTSLFFRSRQLAHAAALMMVLGCGDDGDDPKEPTPDAALPSSPDAATPSGGDAAADAAIPGDSSVPSVIPTINGCTAAMYTDKSTSTGTQTIVIEGGTFTYTPKCLIVAKGTTVRWEGSLATHPLKAGPVAGSTGGTAGSPIVETDTGSSVEFTFANAGTFPYFCTIHAPVMAGSIHVK